MFLSEKAMATHSSTLAWKIPWTEEPGSSSLPDCYSEALELTQLSAFQQALKKLQEVTPDPASGSNMPLFVPGTEVLIKTLGSGGHHPGKALTRLFFLLSHLSKCQELNHGCTTLELRGDTLPKTK